MQQQQDQWVAATDEASGAQYWYNPATLETAWERPQAAAAPAATDVPATPAGIDERGNTNPLGIPYLPNGGRMGQLLPARSAAEQKNMLKGGKDGLMAVRCVCVCVCVCVCRPCGCTARGARHVCVCVCVCVCHAA